MVEAKGNEMVNHVWVYVGKVTDPDAYEGKAYMGQPEYQFSDAPEEERGSSADYVDLVQGLKDHSGYVIHWRG